MQNHSGPPAVTVHALDRHTATSRRLVTVWRQHFRRNEALDTAVYALAIAELVPRPRRRRPRLVRV